MYAFMAPIIERTLESLSCPSAQLCLEEITNGPFPTTLKAALLKIVVSHPHVRSLVRDAVIEGCSKEGPYEMPSNYDRNFWTDVFRNSELLDFEYGGNIPEFLEGIKDFNDLERESFLEEWCVPVGEYESVVIVQGEWLLLEILGRSGWASFGRVVNRAIGMALDCGGTRESMRTFEAALAIGMYRRKRVRQMCLLTDWVWGLEPTLTTSGVPEEGDTTRSTTTTAFEVCSLQPPNCETAARILRSLLKTLKMGDVRYPPYSVGFLRYAFMIALQTAVEISGAIPVRLRVLEVWLECCEDILIPVGHSQWRTALRLNNAELLRETMCVWTEKYRSPFGGRKSRFDWRLKIDEFEGFSSYASRFLLSLNNYTG
jgi:hypothetical protein